MLSLFAAIELNSLILISATIRVYVCVCVAGPPSASCHMTILHGDKLQLVIFFIKAFTKNPLKIKTIVLMENY